MYLEILAAIPVLYIAKCIFSKDPKPINGVYFVPGKWYHIKKAIFTCMYFYRKWKSKKDTIESGEAGYGMKSRISMEQMDKPQLLSDHPDALDAVYFNGFHSDGTCIFLRIGRRHGRKAEIWLFLQIPGLGDYQYPLQPDTIVYNTDGKSFTAGGLKCDVIDPMKSWRITFNGLLRKGLYNKYSEDKGYLVHVRFSFLWKAFTEVFDFDTDIPWSVISDTISREKWSREYFNKLKERHQTHYEQGGEMSGILQLEGEEKILHLRGMRDHTFGVRDWRSFHRYIVNYVWLEDGRVLHIGQVCIPGSLSMLTTGFVVTPNAMTSPVTWTDMNMPMLGDNNNPPDDYSISFTAGSHLYHLNVHAHTTVKLYHEEDWGNIVYEKLCHFDLDGTKGYGICEFAYRNSSQINPSSQQQSLPVLREPDLVPDDYVSLAVPFSKISCGSSQLVGGKGCQLALLTSIKKEHQFDVSSGFCITVTAYKVHLQSNPDLQILVQELVGIACGKTSGTLQNKCQEAVQMFSKVPVCGTVQKAVAEELIRLFGYRHAEVSFAVRSSAAGEDSEEMSAAGQMETMLGVKGVNNIFTAIARCWASQFAFQAVEYRRQHGQPIDSLMGIVIQQMVKSEASGVLFTRDPLTGNPSLMNINCNFGLGESVVSGVAEPDTIIVSRTWDDKVSVKEKHIGGKKIRMHVSDSGGTETIEVTSNEAVQCCLRDDTILELARIGIMIEKSFSDPRDIEWAVCENKIYLLQARPITSFDVESEWELMHEFDTPVNTDRMWLTTANIGEMMPGAVTPLTHSVFLQGIEDSITSVEIQAGVRDHLPGVYKSMGSFCNHTFINLSELGTVYENNILGNDKRVAEITIMGHCPKDITMEHIIEYSGQQPFLKRLRSAVKSHTSRYQSYGKTAKWGEMLETYTLVKDNQSSRELYDQITTAMPNYRKCWTDTVGNSGRSGMMSAVLLSVLAQGKPDWTTEYYADVAMMLANCPDVYSADVPTAIQALAHSISQSSNVEEFLCKSPEKAAEWLLTPSSGEIGNNFRAFLKRHGHRCVRESEFREKSWHRQPEKVVKVIQSVMKNGREVHVHKEDVSANEAISRLKTPITFFGRQTLKAILPKARAAVADREWGKSISIKMVDVFKEAYLKLSEMLMSEGRLPDSDLMYFLSHREIGQLLDTRSARLIAKAVRRRKILPKQMEVEYPELNVGYPQCVETNGSEEYVITSVTLSGMPVSNGVVKGTARVVTSLELADQIQPNDILIVHYTDVGWTPYFPLISGLITEIGGLLSHGAVVAREYGIPCVVNMQKATTMFNTGDQVLLNATKGTLEKLE